MEKLKTLDLYAHVRTTASERRAQLLTVDLEKAISINTSKGSLQYDPVKRGEVTIGERTFPIEHCLFNYTVSECKGGEGAVFVYTRQTLSQAICLSKAICMIVTNALLAREGNSTAFYFDLRHGEELSEKAINQLKACAADLYGQEGQIILCKEITPVLRMMANGLDVPVLLSVPVLRNEKEITRQFYKALKNNAHEVPTDSSLAITKAALLKSLCAENLLISKLDSTGPGLWMVDSVVYVTSPDALVNTPGSQMSLHTEQALHVSLLSSGVDALTIVEVVRLLKYDYPRNGGDRNTGRDADNDADASDADVDDSDGNNIIDSIPDHPLSDHHSSHSSCHSDLSILASTIPDLAAVQALTQFATPAEVPNRSMHGAGDTDTETRHTPSLATPNNVSPTLQGLNNSTRSEPKADGHGSRPASVPVSCGPSTAQLKTISAPAPARRALTNGAAVPSHTLAPTQSTPLLAPVPSSSHSTVHSTAPPLSTANSNTKPTVSLPAWMQELQQSRRTPIPLFTPTTEASQPPPFLLSAPHKSPLKRKDWSISTDSDSDTVLHPHKRRCGTDHSPAGLMQNSAKETETSEPLPQGGQPTQNQRSTIRKEKWVKVTRESHQGDPVVSGTTAAPATDTPISCIAASSTNSLIAGTTSATHTTPTTPHLIGPETEAFLTLKRRTAALLKQVTPTSQSATTTTTTTPTAPLTKSTLAACVDTTSPRATKSVTEICDTASQSSHSTGTIDTLTQPPLQQPLSALLPSSVRHATTGITMYASTSADYERLSDFLEYALTEDVQRKLLSMSTAVVVYRGAVPPALSPEVVCVELNQNTLPASAFKDLVHAQLALRREVTIKVEEEE